MKSILIALATSFMTLTNIYGQGQWEIANEGLALDSRAVFFISSDTGWIAGGKGLFKTTDGCETWELVNGGSKILELDFVDDSIGWAIGDSKPKTILITLDGGKTWNRQTEIRRPLWEDAIEVVSENTLYASGRDSILKTMDGGSHWENITPLDGSDFICASFCNADTGIVVGTIEEDNESICTIYKTLDGGESWIKQPTTISSMRNIKYKNDSSAYCITNDVDSCYIYTTSNMFKSWNVINPPGSHIYYCHFFGDDTIVTMVGERFRGSRSILKSTDGGFTWNKTDHMQLFSGGWGYPIRMYAIEDKAYTFASDDQMNFILKSENQGNHWSCMNLSFPLRDVSFRNQDNGLIAGSTGGFHWRVGYLFTTQNGGETWNIDFDVNGMFPEKIHYLNDSLGFFIRDGWLFNIKSFQFPIDWETWDRDDLHLGCDLFSLGDSICFLLNNVSDPDMGIIKQTVDGGNSWQKIYMFDRYFSNISEYPLELKSLFFLDENKGYTVGTGGLIIKLSEQGSWERIESGTRLPLNKVFFADQEFGLIAGGYSNSERFLSILLVTKDGGDHWAKVPDIPYLIHDIHFLDSLHGFAVGEDKNRRGILLETIDRGESWNEVIFAESLSGPVYALHFVQGVGWAVGENSLILKYIPSSTSNKEYPVKCDENFFRNYPNPFYSRTVISYLLPTTGIVELSIYDISGRKAATLVHESQFEGMHEIEWNASGMQPGIYFCELKTSQGRQVNKLILVE